MRRSSSPYPVVGDGEAPFGTAVFPFGPDGADNQDHTAAFAVTSSILDPARFPTFADSRRLADWQRPGAGPFRPYTGDYYAAANADDRSYKRLRKTVDLTGKTSGELQFRLSADLEEDYDYVFVEAHTVGQDDWTTLPGGDNTSTDTGLSCPTVGDGSAWQTLHPWLARYQTVGANGECTGTGTTGAWNAATGNSGGWEDWAVDLLAYAGKQVEVSITVATDPASLGLGVWVDDAKVVVDGATVEETSFETDLGGWEVGPPPPGTVSQVNGWERVTEQFEEGSVVGTDETVYTGFGFEGLAGPPERNAFMRGALQYLGILGGGGG